MYSGGSGTELDPYLIANAQDFYDIRFNSTLYFKQTTDIDLSIYPNWIPASFSGHYDGDNYKILNLHIEINSGSSNLGLFTTLSNSSVKNLVIENAFVKQLGSYQNTAILSGFISNAYLDNIVIKNGWVESPEAFVGGLAGRAEGANTVIDCGVEGVVKGYNCVGGLVGFNYDVSTYSKCYVRADIYWNVNQAWRGSALLIGYFLSGTMENCYAIGRVYGTGTSYNGLAAGILYDGIINKTFCALLEPHDISFIGTSFPGNGENNLVDTESTGYDAGVRAVGISTLQAKDINTYLWYGWDFIDIWAISPDINDGYPYLQWEVAETQASEITILDRYKDKLRFSFTRGSGEYVAVFMKQASSGVVEPVNGSLYIADTEFGEGSQIGSTGWFCVYNGNDAEPDITVLGLNPGTDYIIQAIEYDGFASPVYYTLEGTNNPLATTTQSVQEEIATPSETLTILRVPTSPAYNLESSNVRDTSFKLNWERGSGTHCLVFVARGAHEGGAEPVDDTLYNADSIFGEGDEIGDTGWFCVYRGTGTSVTVTGLVPEALYSVHVLEVNIFGSIVLYDVEVTLVNTATIKTAIEYISTYITTPIYLKTKPITIQPGAITHLSHLMFDYKAEEPIYVAVEYRYNRQTQFKTTSFQRVHEENGAIYFGISALEFRITISCASAKDFRIYSIGASYKVVDKRAIRGIYVQ